jgi:hypothetical protein
MLWSDMLECHGCVPGSDTERTPGERRRRTARPRCRYDQPVSDADDSRGPSRLRFAIKELAILAVGLVVLFIALVLVVSFVAPLLGWSMCCQ